MGKIENLDKYIKECDEMMNVDSEEQLQFITRVVSVYANEITNIREELDAYLLGNSNYALDLQNIKAKLINHRDNLELEEQKRKDELELARLKQGHISVSATANNSNEIKINVTLEQALECISKIPDEVMSQEEKDDLEDKLSGIDNAVKTGKKEKAKEKIFAVLKFLMDKGADALIAMLPYLAQMAGLIQNI